MTDKKIIVLVGPSGSGKTSIGEKLNENGIPRLVTTTTRRPREGEQNGIDYYFRTFSSVDIDEFVEQTIYNGNRYGLTKAEVQNKLKQYDVVHVSLDQSGVDAVCKAFPEEACVVFISITEQEMIRRMQKRGDSKEAIQERIEYSQATNELVPPANVDLVIINDNVEKSAQAIIDYIS